MIVGIDYRLAASSHRGMGRYCREIVEKLFEIDRENDYILYVDKDCDRILPSNFKWKKLPTSNFILAEQLCLPFAIRHDKLDVMWSPSNTFPLFTPRSTRLIVTIHDLIFMYPLPKGQNFIQRIGALYRRWVFKLGKKRIDEFVTVSTFSASELKRIANIDNSMVTYNCIESFYKAAKTILIPDKHDKFYFTLSADAPSKNLDFLLGAFKNKLADHTLIIGGIKGDSPLREVYSSPNIIFLENGISDDELIKYYKSCEAFVYVSLFEGFGIPPLEALACGAKVICSNSTSLPEVVGQHGILIDPRSEDQLIKAIKEISDFKTDRANLDLHLSQFIDWKAPAYIIHKLISQ